MARLVIVRHGNTFAPGEIPRRVGARTDVSLVDSGRSQARALAEHFTRAEIAFDRILASPLRRTRETAEAIAPGRIEAVDWLREIDHGPDENRPEAEVLARIGSVALDAWDQDGIPPPGWVVDGEARIAAWQRCFGEVGAETWLLATSNGAARFALLALGLAPSKIRTGAYAMLTGEPWRVEAWDVRPD